MRHKNHNRKFGRERGQRKALLRSLCRSLVIKGRIQTTEAKAKELRPHIEKLLSRGRSASLADRRLLMAELRDARALGKLIKTAQNYTTRAGGYTRIVKLIKRKGDASPMAIIEFV